ncbi:TonB C-terminal domain-containing protein [Paracoccus endophyticus]|uniref:TonB C-terminal domain-containing protein n=1 Tax=Paracoccus endophyticus TaxID=2233774 RepID=UPI000DD87889|nr:TonB C-terminal domain-containing protein [Paracoccus endophyticus]
MNPGGFLGRTGVWFAATAAVCAAHVAAAQLLLANVAPGPHAPPPDAVMVELAAEPPAAAPASEAASPLQDSSPPQATRAEASSAKPASDAVPAAPALKEPQRPPLPTLPPVSDTAALFPAPPEPPADFTVTDFATLPPLGDFAALVPSKPLAASRRPAPRPDRDSASPRRADRTPAAQTTETRQDPSPDHTPRPQPAEPRQASQQADRAAEAGRAGTGREGGKGSSQRAPGRAQMQSWQSQVGARISRHMARTRLPGGRGAARVQVSVTIAANGAATARLVSSTGDPGVDAALARQAARLPRMPAPPGGTAQSFIQPIRVEF